MTIQTMVDRMNEVINEREDGNCTMYYGSSSNAIEIYEVSFSHGILEIRYDCGQFEEEERNITSCQESEDDYGRNFSFLVEGVLVEFSFA